MQAEEQRWDTEELARLREREPHRQNQTPYGELVELHVSCAEPLQVLERTKELLRLVLEKRLSEWSTDSAIWKGLLPTWFVSWLVPDAEYRRHVAKFDAVRKAEGLASALALLESFPCSLEAFLSVVEPNVDEAREWRWWSGKMTSNAELRIELVVWDVGFSYAGLRWILRSAGATRIEKVI